MDTEPETFSSSLRTVQQPLWRRVVRQGLPFVIVLLAVIAFSSGLVGFFKQDCASRTGESDWTIPFLKTVQLFLLNSGTENDSTHPNNWFLTIARFTAALWFLVVYSAIMRRIVIEVRKLPLRLTRKKHVVIAGLGPIGLQILDDLHEEERDEEVVVIESNPNSPWVEHARRQGADVIIGDATMGDVLDQARMKHASMAFVATGNDGVNLEIAAGLAESLQMENDSKRDKTKLYMHIEDANLAASVQQHIGDMHDTKHLDLRVFNLPRTVAAHLITRQLWPHVPQKHEEVAHFVIIGFGTMGQALAVQLARLGHFPNLKRSRFTIADREIERSAAAFLSRYPRFTSWLPGQYGVKTFHDPADLWTDSSLPLPSELAVNNRDAVQYVANAKFEEICSTTADELFVHRLVDDFRSSSVKPVLFICGQQDRENFETAIAIKEKLTCLGHPDVPTFAWMPRQPALVAALERDKRIQPFGECKTAASLEEIVRPMREELAVTLHKDYEKHAVERAVKRGEKRVPSPWDDRDRYRESNLEAAEHLQIKLAALGYRLQYRDHPSEVEPVRFSRIQESKFDMLAIMEHNRWMAERFMSGWRFIEKAKTPDEIKTNKERKLHHNLIPWDKLDEDDRERDFEQINIALVACQKNPFRLERM